MFIFVAILLFSTVFVFSKQIIPPLTSISYMFLRSIFGTLFLTVILASRKLFPSFRQLVKECWKDVLIFSLVFHLLPLILVFVSTPMTLPTDQVIINNLSLSFVVIINLIFFRIKPTKYLVVAVAVNFAGAVLVLWPLDFSQNPNLVGDIIMIIAVFIGSFFSIWNKKLSAKADPLVLGYSINVFPAAVSFPLMLATGQASTMGALSPLGWCYIIFIGIGISGIAYFCLNLGYCEPGITPELMSTWTTLIPVFGMVISIFLYGYVIGPVNILGSIMVIVSIVIANKAPTRAARPLSKDGEEKK
nr:DMT family transporter [Candidatus Sigynarchaeota archaeon]